MYGTKQITARTIRTMLRELSTPKTQARAFSYLSFTGNMGIFLGPLIGGALADPAHQYPGLFGHLKFFQKFPYALATFTTGTFGLIAMLTCAAFLKEVC